MPAYTKNTRTKCWSNCWRTVIDAGPSSGDLGDDPMNKCG